MPSDSPWCPPSFPTPHGSEDFCESGQCGVHVIFCRVEVWSEPHDRAARRGDYTSVPEFMLGFVCITGTEERRTRCFLGGILGSEVFDTVCPSSLNEKLRESLGPGSDRRRSDLIDDLHSRSRHVSVWNRGCSGVEAASTWSKVQTVHFEGEGIPLPKPAG